MGSTFFYTQDTGTIKRSISGASECQLMYPEFTRSVTYPNHHYKPRIQSHLSCHCSAAPSTCSFLGNFHSRLAQTLLYYLRHSQAHLHIAEWYLHSCNGSLWWLWWRLYLRCSETLASRPENRQYIPHFPNPSTRCSFG